MGAGALRDLLGRYCRGGGGERGVCERLPLFDQNQIGHRVVSLLDQRERERKRKREEKDSRRTPKPESSCLTTTKLCLFEPLYEPPSGSVDARARRARRSEGEREWKGLRREVEGCSSGNTARRRSKEGGCQSADSQPGRQAGRRRKDRTDRQSVLQQKPTNGRILLADLD